MSKFTPGPWALQWYERDGNTCGDILAPEGWTIAIACGSAYGTWLDHEDDGEGEFKANAHLISAAPDMYEALLALVESDERVATHAVMSALAKAEGKV